VQKLLGHSSRQTTGDIYADWDVNQFAPPEALDGDGPQLSPYRIIPVEPHKAPANEPFIPPTGFEPVLPP
jgi:hypothetical protein